MATPWLHAHDLGKRYRIGRRQEGAGSLRVALTRALAAPFRRIGAIFQPPDPEETIWALRGLSFAVHPGEVVGVVGRNGAGKSTLLKILSRVTAPTEGRVELHGRLASLLEVGTGFHPELTGRENVFLNGAILGLSQAEIRRQLDSIVAFAEIERFLDTPVKRYSSGMYVRLAFAVAAHLDPDVLLVDEVLSVGDEAFRRKCLGQMEAVSGRGRAVIFVSHQLAAIRTLCPRCLWLAGGELRADGPTEEVLSRYLSDGGQGAAVRDFEAPPDPEAAVWPVRLALVDAAGQPVAEARSDAAFGLALDVTIRQPTRLRAVLTIHAADGTAVTTVATSTGEAEGLPPGPHRLLARITSPRLVGGTYTVALTLGHAIYGRAFHEARAIDFPVVDVDAVGGSAWEHTPGPVRAEVAWETTRLTGA